MHLQHAPFCLSRTTIARSGGVGAKCHGAAYNNAFKIASLRRAAVYIAVEKIGMYYGSHLVGLATRLRCKKNCYHRSLDEVCVWFCTYTHTICVVMVVVCKATISNIP